MTAARFFFLLPFMAVAMLGQSVTAESRTAQGQQLLELSLSSDRNYSNPYTDVDLYVTFFGPAGAQVRRPAFWDGGGTWRVRFLPTREGPWSWRSTCSETSDRGLHDRRGSLTAIRYQGANALLQHGLLTMSAGHRNVRHSNGAPFMLVADTAWSLAWRGTAQSVTVYAEDRAKKGFNATLLMSVQPDRKAQGPRDRSSVGGFDVGFEDLSAGHLQRINIEYFRYMDQLMQILSEFPASLHDRE